jgi:murein DD-endopeptidase MepM/ murein hydrolase activator NlpD
VFWLAFALAIELSPATVQQGQVARIKAPAEAATVHFLGKSIPLFANADGTRSGLIPVPALSLPGRHELQILDAGGKLVENALLSVQDARFKSQNITLGRSLRQLKPAPGEMETLAALRNTVSPNRYWTEPFEVPVPGCLTSPFGVKRLYNGKPSGNFHSGLDQRSAMGTPIRAISGGVVKIVRKFNINGDIVGIDHGQGVTSFYLHMSRFATTEGATVKKGDIIGYVGSSGRSTAPHLHWGLDVFAVPVNPLQWMKIGTCEAEPAKAPRPAGRSFRRSRR